MSNARFGLRTRTGQVSDIVQNNQFIPALLDEYPNAAAAYSLRFLRSAYTGNAIRVRRSNDNAEQDIGFDTSGNLDTSALTSFVGANNGFVVTWYDQSGNARNATQSTAANQPQIVSSGSVILENGKPSIQFDGSNDFFDITLTITSQPIYSFAVSQLNWTFPIASAVVGPDDFTNGLVYGRRGSTGYWILFAGTVLVDTVGDSLQNLHSVYANGVNSFYYLNGTQILNGNAGTGYEIDYIGRSGTDYQSGKSQEILIYNSNQSSNRTGIETNINTHYAIY